MQALGAERRVVLDLIDRLEPDDWGRPSGCPGWSVQDVIAHLGTLYRLVVDPSQLPDAGDRLTEDAQDFYVRSRRTWTSEEVARDYISVSESALQALEGLAGQDFEVPLGDVGTYAARVVPFAFAFDHFTHIRADLFEPRGPLSARRPPVDGLTLSAALTWVEAALPQQNGPLIAGLPGPVALEVAGEGGRTIVVGGSQAGDVQAGPLATVTSDGLSFICWVTGRDDWESVACQVSGDPSALAALEGVKVF